MHQRGFKFSPEEFNSLFPFYLLFNHELTILSVGKSLEKLVPDLPGKQVVDWISIQRPSILQPEFESLKKLTDQLLVWQCGTDDKITYFRGQLKWFEAESQFLLLGSPWFESVDQLVDRQLSIRDFAFHDPLIDLLHVLKNQEINANELKELLQKINKQKNELKVAAKAVQDMSLFPMQNPDPLIRLDESGNILLMNPAAKTLQLVNYQGILYSFQDFWKMICPQIDKESDRWLVEAVVNNRTYSFVCKYLSEPKFFNIYGRNITAEKAGQEEIKRLSLVASSNENGVLFIEPDGKIKWSNQGFCKLSGYTKDEIQGKTPIDLLWGPLTDKASLKEMLEAFAAGKNFLVELIHYKKDGTTFWGRSKGQAVYNEPGSLIQYFAIIEDISQEKEQEEQLRILSLIAEENLNSVMIADADGRITWVNKGFTKMTGFLLEEVIGKRPGHFLQGPETDPKTVQYLSAQIKAGAPFLCEILNYNKSGQPYWLRIQGQAIRNKKGVVTGFFALEEDISNERAINDALRFKEEKYRNILANMHLGIVEVDLEEKILYVNQRFCEISGYDEIELIGQNARTLFMTRENGRIMQEKLSLRKKGKADAYEIMVKNKSGETRWWLISGAPRYDDKGELVGSIGIHLDITEQKTLQDELLEARELAEASSKAKEIFLANMSHEIRTPMHAISGMAELLSKTKLIERQRFYLGVIQSASENMLVILNDILDMSKLEANKLTLEQIGFDIKLVLEKAIAVMQHRAEEKSLVLRLEKIDAGISTILIGDPFRLNQILFNLISNAIKFTERGQILLECQLQEQNENRQTLVLKVTDTGIGMDQEFLEQLFDKFTQEHQSTSRNFGGTGLGMNITKELVELMDGQIEVESQKGKGSVFTLSIPFKIGQHMDLPDLKKEVINPDIFKGLKILLVDDNDMNRLVANTMLENLGAKCVEAVNGKEAVEYMETNHADLILMDIQMPVMDGLQATGIIKKMKHSPPIIALTANALKSDNEKYLKAGMVDSLPKPFSEDEFINLISRVITKSRGQKVANTLSIQISEIPLFDLRNLVKISNGNQSLIRKMLLLFLEQTPGMLQQMEKALKEKNLQAISELAHKMKPSLDNLGIISLKEVVRKLEKAKDENLGLEEVKALQINLTYTLNLAFEKLQIEMEKT